MNTRMECLYGRATRLCHTSRDKNRYIEMVQSKGAMQLSMGAATIPGIVTGTREFVLCLTPDKNGQPREPTKKSLTDILQLMEIADKKFGYASLESPTEFTQVISPHD